MNAEIERQLRAQLRSQVAPLVPPQYVDEIVDLAFHASSSAIATVHAVAERASCHNSMLAVLGPAFSILAAEAQARVEGLQAYAAQHGLASTMLTMTAKAQ